MEVNRYHFAQKWPSLLHIILRPCTLAVQPWPSTAGVPWGVTGFSSSDVESPAAGKSMTWIWLDGEWVKFFLQSFAPWLTKLVFNSTSYTQKIQKPWLLEMKTNAANYGVPPCVFLGKKVEVKRCKSMKWPLQPCCGHFHKREYSLWLIWHISGHIWQLRLLMAGTTRIQWRYVQ